MIMSSNSICSIKHLNHVCIAVNNIEETLNFYSKLFGTKNTKVIEIKSHAVRAALVKIGTSQLEFIQPTDTVSGVAKFLKHKGEGMHHICFEVQNLKGKLHELEKSGIDLIDKIPTKGLSGEVAFLHPHSTRGVLIELVDEQSVRK